MIHMIFAVSMAEPPPTGNDDIGLELMHLGQTLHSVLDLGIDTDIEELGSLNARVTQLVNNGVAGTQLIQSGVGDNESAFEVINFLHLPQSHTTNNCWISRS